MRVATRCQLRLDCTPVNKVQLNIQCRHEIVPLLRALQHIYSRRELREEILKLVAKDVNRESSAEVGREGMTYWQILVLAAARQELDLDYDGLQDLAENHRNLRRMMELGEWEGNDEEPDFNWRRIRDNVCLARPETLERINQLIVGEGHRLVPEAVEAVRGDTFVVKTNIHYPTESSLIRDGVRKIIEIAVLLVAMVGVRGWRQHQHLWKKVKSLARQCDRVASKKGPRYQERLAGLYRELLQEAETILERARELERKARRGRGAKGRTALADRLAHYCRLTEQVCGTARRRILNGEKVPNSEKLFSIFEPETQLFKRGKAGEPVQFGHLTLVVEDAAGFICHYQVLPKGAQEREIVVPEMRGLQTRFGGKIKKASLDRGFHSPENQKQLAEIFAHPCVPMTGSKKSREQEAAATVEFREARQRHPGVESAIGALQSGNGLERCRDHTYRGFCRYVGLGILGRNLHVLGKILLKRDDPRCLAARSQRKRAAA
jgi:transposase, IS5 family